MKKDIHNLLLIIVLFLPFVLAPSTFAQTTSPLVCLDPGHGGHSGAYNAAYNLWEDDINLDVASRLGTLLSGSYRVEMTRTDNSYKTNNDRYTFCNSFPADILVSVHTNSSVNTSIDGSMALYFKGSDKVLARVLLANLYPVLNNVSWTFTNFGLSRYASGVLLKSDMPAAMMETVMLSYDSEAALLVNTGPSSRRQQIAQGLFDGINKYFAENPGGGDGGGGGGGKKCESPPCKN